MGIHNIIRIAMTLDHYYSIFMHKKLSLWIAKHAIDLKLGGRYACTCI